MIQTDEPLWSRVSLRAGWRRAREQAHMLGRIFRKYIPDAFVERRIQLAIVFTDERSGLQLQ
ncbi:hypothetical protein RZS41_26060 [Burkholderia pseudomallei]|uniref:hypothetical protein n=1 Tax=Burkholderia pseudomallei TaxID=28450 RepID=UPI0029321C1C|nr:hypothetical protein [Burkholderia pseudomallei]MDV2086347.1 hypothetical protein [Burkholderia pseudomallei]